MGYVDGHIHTLTKDFNRNRITVILVIKKESECLSDRPKFIRNICE